MSENKSEYLIDGKVWVTVLGAKLLLGKLDGSDMGLSQQSVRLFQERYGWKTMKVGVTRLYLKKDVIDKTPSRIQRWAKPYNDARAKRDKKE